MTLMSATFMTNSAEFGAETDGVVVLRTHYYPGFRPPTTEGNSQAMSTEYWDESLSQRPLDVLSACYEELEWTRADLILLEAIDGYHCETAMHGCRRGKDA